MKQLTIFRILTFILLPLAAIFGVIDLVMLAIALSNPSMLFPVFTMASFVIYTFVSLRFLTKGIDIEKPCNPSLRDWIRVNAFVSAFMGTMLLMNTITIFFMSDAMLRQTLEQILEKQVNVSPLLNLALFVKMMKMAAWFMLFISLILLSHIFINFRLLKQFKHLFQEPMA
jgi:hypothetical protein